MSDDDKITDMTLADLRSLMRETVRLVVTEMLLPVSRKKSITKPAASATQAGVDRARRGLRKAGFSV